MVFEVPEIISKQSKDSSNLYVYEAKIEVDVMEDKIAIDAEEIQDAAFGSGQNDWPQLQNTIHPSKKSGIQNDDVIEVIVEPEEASFSALHQNMINRSILNASSDNLLSTTSFGMTQRRANSQLKNRTQTTNLKEEDLREDKGSNEMKPDFSVMEFGTRTRGATQKSVIIENWLRRRKLEQIDSLEHDSKIKRAEIDKKNEESKEPDIEAQREKQTVIHSSMKKQTQKYSFYRKTVYFRPQSHHRTEVYLNEKASGKEYSHMRILKGALGQVLAEEIYLDSSDASSEEKGSELGDRDHEENYLDKSLDLPINADEREIDLESVENHQTLHKAIGLIDLQAKMLAYRLNNLKLKINSEMKEYLSKIGSSIGQKFPANIFQTNQNF